MSRDCSIVQSVNFFRPGMNICVILQRSSPPIAVGNSRIFDSFYLSIYFPFFNFTCADDFKDYRLNPTAAVYS